MLSDSGPTAPSVCANYTCWETASVADSQVDEKNKEIGKKLWPHTDYGQWEDTKNPTNGHKISL